MLSMSQHKRGEDRIEIHLLKKMRVDYIKALDMRMVELKEEQQTKRKAQRDLRIERNSTKDMEALYL
jgi:hypothetical protein